MSYEYVKPDNFNSKKATLYTIPFEGISALTYDF